MQPARLSPTRGARALFAQSAIAVVLVGCPTPSPETAETLERPGTAATPKPQTRLASPEDPPSGSPHDAPVNGRRTGPEDPYVGGIQINEPRLERWIDAVRSAGLNTVSTTVYAKQADWDSATIGTPIADDDFKTVQGEIRAAKAAGLRVVLILRVALDHAYPRNRFLWHGLIWPKTEADLDAWFRSYRAFAVAWAEFAAENGVDVLGIGSELNRLTSTRPIAELPPLEAWYLDAGRQAEFHQKVLAFGDRITAEHRAALGGGAYDDNASFLVARSDVWRRWAEVVTFSGASASITSINHRRAVLEKQWRRLIADVRKVYGGQLTYAANFDQFHEVAFWDALDIIGINAYFELTPDLAPQADRRRALTDAWRNVFRQIERFRAENGLRTPVLFTELGYTYRRHSTVKPWAQSGFEIIGDRLVIWEDEPEDPLERATALAALRQVARCEHRGVFRGLLYWKLSSWLDQRPIEPFAMILGQNDPAQSELTRFLSGDCPSSPSAR